MPPQKIKNFDYLVIAVGRFGFMRPIFRGRHATLIPPPGSMERAIWEGPYPPSRLGRDANTLHALDIDEAAAESRAMQPW
jgi:hypothetical protein